MKGPSQIKSGCHSPKFIEQAVITSHGRPGWMKSRGACLQMFAMRTVRRSAKQAPSPIHPGCGHFGFQRAAHLKFRRGGCNVSYREGHISPYYLTPARGPWLAVPHARQVNSGQSSRAKRWVSFEFQAPFHYSATQSGRADANQNPQPPRSTSVLQVRSFCFLVPTILAAVCAEGSLKHTSRLLVRGRWRRLLLRRRPRRRHHRPRGGPRSPLRPRPRRRPRRRRTACRPAGGGCPRPASR